MTNKIDFTEEANTQIKRIVSEQEKDCYFRISVLGGGCSGFKYNFTTDSKIQEDDIKSNNLVIDKTSLQYLAGSTLEYHDTLIEKSFKIKKYKLKM